MDLLEEQVHGFNKETAPCEEIDYNFCIENDPSQLNLQHHAETIDGACVTAKEVFNANGQGYTWADFPLLQSHKETPFLHVDRSEVEVNGDQVVTCAINSGTHSFEESGEAVFNSSNSWSMLSGLDEELLFDTSTELLSNCLVAPEQMDEDDNKENVCPDASEGFDRMHAVRERKIYKKENHHIPQEHSYADAPDSLNFVSSASHFCVRTDHNYFSTIELHHQTSSESDGEIDVVTVNDNLWPNPYHRTKSVGSISGVVPEMSSVHKDDNVERYVLPNPRSSKSTATERELVRRKHLRHLLRTLRLQIPSLQNSPGHVPMKHILREATALCRKLNHRSQRLNTLRQGVKELQQQVDRFYANVYAVQNSSH